MARLGRDEIKQHRAWLNQWRCPADMGACVEKLMNHVGDDALFTQAGLDFIRNAWGAAKFGIAREVVKVRLVDDNCPHFELIKRHGSKELFELPEADLEGRRE